MKKIFIFLFSISISTLLLNCKPKEKTVDFSELTANYFDDKNELSPLDATQSGQNEYNDQLQFEMTDSFRKKQKDFFEKYQTALAKIDTTQLKEEEKNS